MTTHTVTVDVQYADGWRKDLAQTDADIRSDYLHHLSDEEVAEVRNTTHGQINYRIKEAAEQAVSSLYLRTIDDGPTRPGVLHADEEDYTYPVVTPMSDATITLTVADFVVTATLTVPDPKE